MKTILAALLGSLLLAGSASAVTWNLMNVTVVVKQGGANLDLTYLTTDDYLSFAAQRSATPKKDLFLGFREDTGVIAVVRRTDELVIYNIVSGLSSSGVAVNSTATKGSISGNATVSSLNTDFSGGFFYDTFRRSGTGFKQIRRVFLGGFQNQTLKGVAVATGKTIDL